MQPVSDVDLEAMVLGETAELLAFSGMDEACRLLGAMIDQGQHRLIYFGQTLEAGLLGDGRVLASINSLFQRNRSASMKTLVNHSHELVHTGQRLIELMRSLMPAVECRIRRPQSAGFAGSCVLVDYSGYLFSLILIATKDPPASVGSQIQRNFMICLPKNGRWRNLIRKSGRYTFESKPRQCGF